MSNDSAFYDKFLKAIKNSKHKINNINQAFYLGGFKFEENIYEEFIKKLKNNNFNARIFDLKYDTQCDNIELYFIKTIENKGFLITMLDPLELYQMEEIIDIFPVTEKSLEQVDKKLIYSK